jgi:hypothetical protein
LQLYRRCGSYGLPSPAAGGTAAWVDRETSMPRLRLSLSGTSILVALALAVWEYYFFFYGGRAEGEAGWFTPTRLGFNMAWLTFAYLSFQLVSIPFALSHAKDRFIGVVDGMASLIPLGVVVVVVFGKSELLGTAERWEAAFLLMLITATDLFGGYAFNIALSRRMFDVAGPSDS